jgi:hydrogenase expression/formation protein HypE
MEDERISLAHGNGGRFMRELIEEVFARHLGAEQLDVLADAAPIELNSQDVLITTDGFTVQPLEFPGGDIGGLAVHGTTNDLAVAGAKPLYLTLNAFIEEGLEIAVLDRIVASLASAAREAGVQVKAGDTKVLRRGEGGGIYLATTGVGVRLPGVRPSIHNIRDGDVALISGSVGDHGTAVMLAREDFGLKGDVQSDAGPVMELTEALMPFDGLRFMRRSRSRTRCRRSATCLATIRTTWPAKAACSRSLIPTRLTMRSQPGRRCLRARMRRARDASRRPIRASYSKHRSAANVFSTSSKTTHCRVSARR